MHMMLREYDALLTEPLTHAHSLRSVDNSKKLAVGNPITPMNDFPGPSRSSLPSLPSSTLSDILATIGALGSIQDKASEKGSKKGSGEDVFLFFNPDNANAFVNHRR